VKRLSKNDALAGDLREAYVGGRSTLWYWRQIIGLIVTSVLRDVRVHPVLTIRGIAGTWVFLRFMWPGLFYVMRFDEVLFASGFRWFYVNGYGFPHWFAEQPVAGISFHLLGFAVCGWLVARFHQPYGVQVLMADVVFVCLWTAINLMLYPQFLALRVLDFLMCPIFTFGGGVVATVRGNAVISHA
jgi:hypothetical protein